MEPAAAQLAAAVLALINTLIARQQHARGLVRLAQWTSFARWGLEGYVIAESNKLTGAAGEGKHGGEGVGQLPLLCFCLPCWCNHRDPPPPPSPLDTLRRVAAGPLRRPGWPRV